MLQHTTLQFRRVTLLALAGTLALAAIVPALVPQLVFAAPNITERELQSTSARPGIATDLTWIFDTTADSANINQIEIEFCDNALGNCTTTNAPTLSLTPTATLTNFTSNGVTSTTTTAGDNGGADNQVVIVKSTVDAGASLDEATVSLAPTDVTNNGTANRTYYTRMRIYSDTGTTLVWEGVFAQSTSQTLTVNARVQERLDFCVGATSVDDGDTNSPTPTNGDCTDIGGTTVDLGNIESGYTNVSPVDASLGGNDMNGIAMIRTNAVNGAVVDYKALLNNSSGALKVAGSTCGSTAPYPTGSSTDQCFNSVANSTITAGQEEFGMVVAGVNCESTTAYTCGFGTGTYNLIRDTDYDGAGAPNNTYVSDSNNVSGTTSGQYTWLDTGAADRIASSAGSTVKVIDDEALILKFAATAGITTPTGSYSVQADYIATATF